ncbi:Transcription factor bHLH [Abeliophyllum distichum]|uniref:Transcription factor bHLH n=1 Tax=Abeliophyllum distichum TaxID=126358 RepID=A0ABD1QXH7_9LAMI
MINGGDTMFPFQHGDELVFQPPSVIIEDQIPEDLNADHSLQKLIHRDIERQRRQETANLYTSLRSLVPLEYLKGKKSISDLMQEAVNYITDTKKNIKKQGLQRDKLKMLSNSGNLNAKVVGSSSSYSPDLVTVNPCLDGVEILISSFKEEGFPLSKVLTELLERGLNVVNCISTKVNERSLHKIQCEFSDLNCNDLSTLQERLTEVINLGRQNS